MRRIGIAGAIDIVVDVTLRHFGFFAVLKVVEDGFCNFIIESVDVFLGECREVAAIVNL